MPVRQMADAAAVLEQVPPGGSVRFEILRGQDRPERHKLDVTFGTAAATALPVAPPRPEAKPVVDPPCRPRRLARTLEDRIRELEGRIRQLEIRIEQFERALRKGAADAARD